MSNSVTGPNEPHGSGAPACGAATRCVECGKGGLPVGVMRNADALQGFERYPALAIVIALHACEPSGKPLYCPSSNDLRPSGALANGASGQSLDKVRLRVGDA